MISYEVDNTIDKFFKQKKFGKMAFEGKNHYIIWIYKAK